MCPQSPVSLQASSYLEENEGNAHDRDDNVRYKPFLNLDQKLSVNEVIDLKWSIV